MKKIIFGLLVVILLLGTLGCGAGSEDEVYYGPATTYTSNYGSGGIPAPTTTVITVPDAVEERSFGLDKPFSGLFDGDKGAELPPPAVYYEGLVPAPTPTVPPATVTGPNSHDAAIPAERMVIRTASMALVVEDVTSALQQITDLAAINGGYVVNSDIREDQRRLYANISFRVDAAKFNDTLQALRNLAVEVRSESTSGQDVTEEYVDLEARLNNLEASEAQLLELMKQAGSVEEILKVQQELVRTRSEIEQIKGRMQYLEQSSSLSYIYASLEQSKLTVDFNASTSTVKEGGKVRFIPTIGGGFAPYSFEWSFGDGETSTLDSPAHAYKKAGTYTVSLTIKDDKGTTAFAERKEYITVLTGWDAGNTASSAWNGLIGFGRFLGSLFIWLGILSPIWIIILAILYFAWWRRRKKKA